MTDFSQAPIHVFSGPDIWLAKFYPYEQYPIYFLGKSETEVLNKAIDWREEQLTKAKHNLEVKRANVAKAQAARKKK